MRRVFLLLAVVAVWWPSASSATCGSCKAEQVTATTANKLLFGGTDAAGGIGDWYLSNGKVQAIVDDIGLTPTSVSGVNVDKTSSNAVETGGTLVDLGLNGKNNDQLPQSFNTGGLSLANVFIFRQGDQTFWGGASNPCTSVGSTNASCPADKQCAKSKVTCTQDADCDGIISGDTCADDCAAITVYGVMLGTCKTGTDFCSTRSAPTMHVRTTYNVCKNHQVLNMRTELMNGSGNTQTLPMFDVLLWGGRGLTPFAADKGRAFTHPALDLSSTAGILAALTQAPYFAAPGNDGPLDGNMSRNKKSNPVSYGYQALSTVRDSNGKDPGGTLTTVNLSAIQSLQSTLLSAATYGIPGPSVPNGASVIFTRRIVLGNRNDVASVVGDKANPDSILLQSPIASGLGTVSGSFFPAPSQEGTVTFYRTGTNTAGLDPGTLNAAYASLNTGAVSEVRCKGSFKNVLLPDGIYTLRAVFAGRDDIVQTGIVVTSGAKTAIPAIPLPKVGKLQIEVRDGTSNTGIPAKVSLSPSPLMRREFAALVFDVRTGICSNSLSTECTINGAGIGGCGAGNTCYRTCTNVAVLPCGPGSTCPGGFTCASDNKCRQHGCNADVDCPDGYLCKADSTDALPESFPGGQAQGAVIYTDKKGKAKVEVRPGTYVVTVSRGPEYTIQKVASVPITAGATNNVGLVSLKRVVDTSGYVSADFHIHSGRSLDSSAPLEGRVRSFSGEGLEVMIATDHDINTDYSPVIKKLGLNGFITSVVGTEVTTSVPKPPYLANGWGHINAWPCVYDANLRRSGSIEDESVSANEIYDRLRNQPNLQCAGGKNTTKACTTNADCPGGTCVSIFEQVVQMNHPRAGLGGVVNIGLFDNIGYDPSKPINNCQKYPVTCASSSCAGGTNDGTSCTDDSACTGGGKCSCGSGSIPGAANGCNNILNDLNVVPQSALCTTPGCGSGFEDPNGTRNLDFDIMEIDNGGTLSGYDDLRQVRRDWMSILNQGIEVGKSGAQHQLYGTGVSDSHRLVVEVPGYSRTYVGAGDLPAPPAVLNVSNFNQEVLEGNMTATTGPFITFTANSGGPDVNMGETLGPSVSSINLKVKVQAAPWIPVDEVRIIKNGCVLACYNSSTSPAVSTNPADPYEQTNADVVRFNATIPDTVTEDSYYIVEASQNLPAPPTRPTLNAVVDSVAAGVFPYGFSNPIFVDQSGDGDYTGITLPLGSAEPVCPPLPPACSGGAITEAAAPASTMFAKATTPAAQPKGLLARLFGRLLSPASADEDRPAPMDDSARVQKRQEDLLKPSQEHIPWNRIEFPTPAPEQQPQGDEAPQH